MTRAIRDNPGLPDAGVERSACAAGNTGHPIPTPKAIHSIDIHGPSCFVSEPQVRVSGHRRPRGIPPRRKRIIDGDGRPSAVSAEMKRVAFLHYVSTFPPRGYVGYGQCFFPVPGWVPTQIIVADFKLETPAVRISLNTFRDVFALAPGAVPGIHNTDLRHGAGNQQEKECRREEKSGGHKAICCRYPGGVKVRQEGSSKSAVFACIDRTKSALFLFVGYHENGF